jgi:hypothetical protein
MLLDVQRTVPTMCFHDGAKIIPYRVITILAEMDNSRLSVCMMCMAGVQRLHIRAGEELLFERLQPGWKVVLIRETTTIAFSRELTGNEEPGYLTDFMNPQLQNVTGRLRSRVRVCPG